MKELSVNYNYSKSNKIFSCIIGGYLILFGSYQCISLAIANAIDVDFYLTLVLVVLGAILICKVTLLASKPILILNSISLYVNMVNNKMIYQSDWTNIREVAIGLSYLKMYETDGKEYNLDLSNLKYLDLKEVKAQIVEICETKNIPYKND